MMRKSTGLALFVFIGLGLLAWQQLGEKQERGISQVSFIDLNISEIDGLTVSGKHPVELRREGAKWVVGSGRRADANAVQRALEALIKIDSTNLVTQKETRFAELKVDSASGTRVVVLKGETVLTDFVIGSAGAGGSNILVGGKVYSMKRVFPGSFSRPTASWVDRTLMVATAKDVARVEVLLDGETPFTFIPAGDDASKWSLEDASVLPSGFRFDYAAAQSVVNTAIGLRAREFVESKGDGSEKGLGQSSDRVVIHFKESGKESQTLVLGKEASENVVYGKILPKGDVFTFSSHSAQLLKRKPLSFRDLRLVNFRVADVVEFKIQDGTQEAVLKRVGGGWTVASVKPELGAGFQIDSKAVEGRLQALTGYRAAGLAGEIKARKTKFKKTEKLILLTLQDGSSVSLEFGAQIKVDEEVMLYARGNMDETTYYVREASLTSVLSDIGSMAQRAGPTGPGMGNIDPAALSQLPPEIREQLMRQLREEQRKQEMLKAFQEPRTAKSPQEGK